jgi:heat shock protein HslJ
MVSTRMACPGMETEQQLLNALESTENYFINSDTLLLHKAKMSTMAKFASVYFK